MIRWVSVQAFSKLNVYILLVCSANGNTVTGFRTGAAVFIALSLDNKRRI